MSSNDKPQKISIGFHGGHVLGARVRPDQLSKLQEVLVKNGGWHKLEAEEGTISVDLTRIDYLLVEREDHRIGF